MLDKYCKELSFNNKKAEIFGVYAWVGDLGGRRVLAILDINLCSLILSLENGLAYLTKNIFKDAKRMIKDFENNEIISWRETHKGCAKQIKGE